MRYRISPSAQSDLEGIWDYIGADNPGAADRFISSLSDRFAMLAKHSRIGRSCDELRPNLRRFPAGNYVVFYRVMMKHVEIIRILHGSRDIDALFRTEDDV